MARVISDGERARNLARAIASDLRTYNEDKVTEGIENGDILEIMSEEIEKGRAFFESRVDPEIDIDQIYRRAIVDVFGLPAQSGASRRPTTAPL